ncbi:MAG: hypothetical protein JWN33_375 [Candidatus Saccharibacteria bacterium]|nr:hypothetical protein [Candidatus Saccharibacteria bacterium]
MQLIQQGQAVSRLAQYLNQHIVGEVSSSTVLRRHYSQDGSVLAIAPELVVYPRTTNDIRKVTLFARQLAEKGHIVGITPRGAGADQTGAAIGSGIVIDMSARLNNIIHVAVKEKFVHAQAGTTTEAINQALRWHGLRLPGQIDMPYATIGGMIASQSPRSFTQHLTRLEVILGNGDVLETGRMNRKEVNRKKGLQTLEGEIYRKIDAITEDHESIIQTHIRHATPSAVGYPGIADVKKRDGSIDLTPLFIGSQGTLGVISEAVIKTAFYSAERVAFLIGTPTLEMGRDLVDGFKALSPALLELIDGRLFDVTQKNGKTLSFISADGQAVPGAVVVVCFDDIAEINRKNKFKKALKLLQRYDGCKVVNSTERPIEELLSVREIFARMVLSLDEAESFPPLIDGAYIPTDRHEEFMRALELLEKKHHITLYHKTDGLSNIVDVRSIMQLQQVGDKQRVLRLISDYCELVEQHGGSCISEGGEGRIKANAAWETIDASLADLYRQVRHLFDPLGTLNPGVKQVNDQKALIAALRSHYEPGSIARYLPYV